MISDSCLSKSPSIKVNYANQPKPDQKSLLLIFDTSGSMGGDLAQLKVGAKEIVRDLSSRADNPIFNYVLVAFNDPGVDPPFITSDVNELLTKLDQVSIQYSGSNPDCPEKALSGLINGLKEALPNSLIYLFTDAGAKDLERYNEVIELIQRKQITVNFLLTGDCHQPKSDQFQVYYKISRVSGGQVFRMDKNKIETVLSTLKENIDSSYSIIKSIEVDGGSSNKIDFDIDASISYLKVTVSGQNPRLTVKNPLKTAVSSTKELSLGSLKIADYKGPQKGTWDMDVVADSAYTVIVSAKSSLNFDYGFSLKTIEDKSHSSKQPLTGLKNILTIFLSDVTIVKDMMDVIIVTVPTSPLERPQETAYKLKKIKDGVYATEPIDMPNKLFKIKVYGHDTGGVPIKRIISSALTSSPGNAPEVSIKLAENDVYEKSNVELKCLVKSQIPVNIAWTFGGKTLEKIHSEQSNELKLIIKNIKADGQGTYKCIAVNKISCETQEVKLNVNPLPKLKIVSTPNEIVEGRSYSLKCNLDSNRAAKIDYMWLDKDDKVIQKTGNTFTSTASHLNNKELIKCRVKTDSYNLEESITLNVHFAPKFIASGTAKTSNFIAYGTSSKFDCSTIENPPRSSIKWYFTPKGSTKQQLIHGLSVVVFEKSNTIKGDDGQYECVVGNKVGENKRKFDVQLVSKESPKIKANKVIIVKETDSTQITCECKDCLPITDHSWTFSNSKTYKSEIIQNDKENSFKMLIKINPADRTDAGMFKCRIVNDLGTDVADVELRVQRAPEVEKTILNNHKEIKKNFDTFEGKSIELDCITVGYPEPTVTWSRNGIEISKSNKLVIPKTSINDEGGYDCIAKNSLGTDQKTIKLDVHFAPRRKSKSITAFESVVGKDVSLLCDLIGKPYPDIIWQFNSKNIVSNKKFIISDNSIKFAAAESDSGIFKCIGKNNYGSAEIEFPGIIKSSPKIFSPNDESIKVINMTTLKLPCDASGYPQPKVKFTRDGKIISNSSPFTIGSAIPSDSGIYHCIAENEVGTAEKIFYVNVVKEPTIVSCPSNITLYTNQTVDVKCSAIGIPEPKIKWKIDGKEIPSKNGIASLSSIHKTGKVTCIAENSEGHDEQSLFLESINIPNILSIAADLQTTITIREKDELKLLCPFSNYNTVEWSFKGIRLKRTEFKQVDKKLTITEINRSHAGDWTCIASNIEGIATFKYDVQVIASPVIYASWNYNKTTTDFHKNEAHIDQKIFKTGENLTLNCTVDGTPTPKVIWRKGIDLIGMGDILTINNLQFHHSDIYSCSAENSQATVHKYFKIDVLSPPYIDRSITIQQDIITYLGESVILRCGSILGNPQPLFIWFKNNELLEDILDDSIVIDQLTMSDKGTYRCIGRNKFGSTKLDFTIDIYEPAQIIQSTEEDENGNVALSCITKGYPLPVVSWTTNGHVLTSTSKLDITSTFKSSNDDVIYFDGFGNGISHQNPFKINHFNDNGLAKLTKIDSRTLRLDISLHKSRQFLHLKQFRCYSFNALGHDEKTVEIVVKQKPHNIQKNQLKEYNIEIMEHMPLNLDCVIDGYPKPQIIWLKEGKRVESSNDVKFINDRKILSISEASLNDAGNYSCIGTNELGKCDLNYRVRVLPAPKIQIRNIVKEKVETFDVLRETDVTLKCLVNRPSSAKISWMLFDNLKSKSKNSLLKDESNDLVLRSVRRSCRVVCHAVDSSQQTVRIFQINVRQPAKIIDHEDIEENLTVKLHHAFTLECNLQNSMMSNIGWTFNSKSISIFDDYVYLTSDHQQVRVSDAKRSHEGKYICTATDNFSRSRKIFNVKIEIPIQYSPWSEWSECSEYCGSTGIQTRSRTCLDSTENCMEETFQQRKCNEFSCPSNGRWNNWSDWSECSVCFNALDGERPKQRRYRRCASPSPTYGGLDCYGNNFEERDCQVKLCPVEDEETEWSKFFDSLN
ncbi:hemicentin-1-like [Chironomus tepperi]|uniref:hemicentin-1-like n=1 Tax=Chironomus tepperi TaxID=113505 RepID=UPI00391F58F6